MKRILGLAVLSLLLLPLPASAADAVKVNTSPVLNKMKPVVSTIKNEKLLDAAKKVAPATGATTTPDETNPSGNTQTGNAQTEAVYMAQIEAPQITLNPTTCRYTWSIRVRNTGTTAVPADTFSVAARVVSDTNPNAGTPNTKPVGSIPVGGFVTITGEFIKILPVERNVSIDVKKGLAVLSHVTYPIPTEEATTLALGDSLSTNNQFTVTIRNEGQHPFLRGMVSFRAVTDPTSTSTTFIETKDLACIPAGQSSSMTINAPSYSVSGYSVRVTRSGTSDIAAERTYMNE
ncbi:MAG: hypothetical protein AB7S81_00380 [Bdellovibrionales bacterium]